MIHGYADMNHNNSYFGTALIYGNKTIFENILFVVKNNWLSHLFKASEYGNLDVVNVLIQAGADVNHNDSDGYTALIYGILKLFWNKLIF